MGIAKQGTFSNWELTEEEQLNGQILTISQSQVLQNELANVADQKLNLTFDPLNPVKFAQEEAFLSGQMSVLRLLLDRSKPSEEELRNRAANQSQSLG